MQIRHAASRALRRLATPTRASQRGVTTLEYVIAAAIVLVVLAAAILAWNNGLADKIDELVRELAGT